MQDANGKVRLADDGRLRALLAGMLADAVGIALLDRYAREQEAELGLVRDGVYEAAASGTDAAGPARARVGAVLRSHGEAQAYMDRLSAMSGRIAASGLDAELDGDEAGLLAGALERASAVVRARALGGLLDEVSAMDGEIMAGMPPSGREPGRPAGESGREDGDGRKGDGGCRIIDITGRMEGGSV